MSTSRLAVIIAAFVAFLGMWLFAGGLIAVMGVGHFRADMPIWKLPEYFWFYRHNPFVMGWLKKGLGAAGLAGVLLILLTVWRPTKLHGAARWANSLEIRLAGLRKRSGILLAKLGGGFLRFDGTEHVLVEAPTRAGKGVGVVIPNLLSWRESLVMLDIKGEGFTSSGGWRRSIGQRVFVFDPLNPEGRTSRYNPLSYINRNDPVEVIGELQKLAVMIVPESSNDSSFFDNSARTAFVGIGAFVAATPTLPFTMGEIYRQFTSPQMQKKFEKLIVTRASGDNPLSTGCVSALRDFISSSPNTFTSVRQTFTARVSIWADPRVDAATAESDFDFATFRTVPTTLYMSALYDDLAKLSPVYALMFQQLLSRNCRELPSKDRHPLKLLVILDELAQLGRMEVLIRGFSFVAGYGVRLIAIFQNRAQMKEAYGVHGAESVIANCGVQMAFRPTLQSDARDISERLGTYSFDARSTSWRTSEGWTRNISRSEQRRPLLLPHEVLEMSAEQVLVFRAGLRPIKARLIRYYKERMFVERSQMALPTIDATVRASVAPPQMAPAGANEDEPLIPELNEIFSEMNQLSQEE